MFPVFSVLSFSLSTFTSDSHTPHGSILQCLGQRHPNYTILSVPIPPAAPPQLGLHQCPICPPLWKVSLPNKGYTFEHHTFLWSTSVCRIVLNILKVSQITDPLTNRRFVQTSVRENERSGAHYAVPNAAWVTEMAGQLRDFIRYFSHCCDQMSERATERSLFWSTVQEPQSIRKQKQGPLCLLMSHWSGSRVRRMLALNSSLELSVSQSTSCCL